MEKFDRFAYRVVGVLVWVGRWGVVLLLILLTLAFFAGTHCRTDLPF